MSAQIIQFPSRRELSYRPSFREFVASEKGLKVVNRVYRVKRRTATFKGAPWGPNTVLLTYSEYDAMTATYEARFGKTYAWQ